MSLTLKIFFFQNIIWIGAENVQTVKILEDLARYLNGLDNIVMEDHRESKDAYCDKPVYGQLIVVINKMMGTASDEQLYKELMEPEPGTYTLNI